MIKVVLTTVINVFALFFLLITSSNASILKSELDEREYQHLALSNGLKVLLVSDRSSSVSGAAMTVQVGGDNDPKDIPGMVHLLEHMVFSGSEKYPERGGFTSFINSAGGSYNAYTTPSYTNFFFQVGASRLQEGLSRFADFLISPSLESEAIAEEVLVIQSEFDGREHQLGWHVENILRHQVNSAHPASRIKMGNREIFESVPNEELSKRLEQYHQRYFTASQMKLVVMGNQSLELLKEWTMEAFEAMRDGVPGETTESRGTAPFMNPGKVPLQIRLQAPGETEVLMLSFEIEPEHYFYKTKPYRFLSRLLESEKPGRLVTELKAQGWINQLGTDVNFQGSDYAMFNVWVSLTGDGVVAKDRIIASIFNYLQNIRESASLEQLYQEQSDQAQEEFRYPSNMQVMREVAGLAVSIMQFPVEEVLTAPVLMAVFDADLIQSALQKIIPENAIVVHAGHFGDLTEVEPITGTTYRAERPDRHRLMKWQDRQEAVETGLALTTNPFMDTEKVVHPLENPTRTPVNLSDREGLKLWYLQDSDFRVPQGVFKVAIESPTIEQTLADSSANLLYTMLLREALTELAQLGADAGIQLAFQRIDQGVVISIQGFTGKQELFLLHLAQLINDLEITPMLLRQAQEKVHAQVDGIENSQYFEQLIVSLNNQLRPGIYEIRGELAAVKELDVEYMRNYHQRFWGEAELTVMVHGNYTDDHARELTEVIVNTLGIETAPLSNKFRTPDIDRYTERTITWVPAGVAVRYYPIGKASPKVMATALITINMLHNELFQRFRDSQQLGYVAFATLTQGYKEWGATLLLQAPGMDPEELDNEIQVVLDTYRQELPGLSPDVFNQYRAGIQQALGGRKQSLSSYSAYWWNTLREAEEPVDQALEAESALMAMDIDEFSTRSRRLVAQDAPVLVLQSATPKHEDD